MERLETTSFGPRNESRRAVPFRYGSCGSVNAFGLNQRFRFGLSTMGLLTTSAVTKLKSVLSRGALETVGVNGSPLPKLCVPLSRHPPASASAMRLPPIFHL